MSEYKLHLKRYIKLVDFYRPKDSSIVFKVIDARNDKPLILGYFESI